MPTFLPEVWSGFAAACSAIAAGLMVKITAANRRDEARPDIILEDWFRADGEGASVDIIGFKKIRNAGKGTAFHLYMFGSRIENNKPVVAFSSPRIAILAPNEERLVNAHAMVWWKNVPDHPTGGKSLSYVIQISAHDSIRGLQVTEYEVIAVPNQQGSLSHFDELAPGVALVSRTTKYTTVRRHRRREALRKAIRGTPLLKHLKSANTQVEHSGVVSKNFPHAHSPHRSAP
jgi:hypothetical protein